MKKKQHASVVVFLHTQYYLFLFRFSSFTRAHSARQTVLKDAVAGGKERCDWVGEEFYKNLGWLIVVVVVAIDVA